MANVEKGSKHPAPERKFPQWPLVGAISALVAQLANSEVCRRFSYCRPEFGSWLRWLAGGLIAVAVVYHFAPRNKNGRVMENPFGLNTLGPAAVLAFTAVTSWFWVKDDDTASTVTLSLTLGGFAVIAWGYFLAAHNRGAEFQVMRDRLLLAIGVSAAFGYANFGHLHFNNFIHTWDTYHYYMGAKYFPEVSYDRMYECAVVADSEDFPVAKLKKMKEQRIITNLRTNIMEKVGETVLLHPEECTKHFSPQRWAAFKKDIAFFRGRVNDKRWEEIHHDHGYNASPVWTLLGHVITNTGPATLEQVVFVDLFDPLYLALMGAMIWWAFGPRVFAVAMLMLGTNWASRFFYWTGGALLRHDWLFFTVAVVCLARKGKPFMAGVALAYASLLRLFPGLLVVGPVLGAIAYAVRSMNPAASDEKSQIQSPLGEVEATSSSSTGTFFQKVLIASTLPLLGLLFLWGRDTKLAFIATLLFLGAFALVMGLRVLENVSEKAARASPRWLDPTFARFVAGGLLATALLVGASFKFFGGVETWVKFATNTSKHAATPLTNHMGMRTIFSSLPWTNGQHMKDSRQLDAWQPWKDKRVEIFKKARPFFALAALAMMALLYFAVKHSRAPLWASASMGAGFIVVGAELTNYYYVFFVAMAALYELKREVGMWLTAMVATCIVIMLTPFGGMSGWQDEQSLVMSFVSLIAVASIWWTFTPWASKIWVEPEPAPNLFGPSTSSSPLANVGKRKKRA